VRAAQESLQHLHDRTLERPEWQPICIYEQATKPPSQVIVWPTM
jgi:hypothetical protein